MKLPVFSLMIRCESETLCNPYKHDDEMCDDGRCLICGIPWIVLRWVLHESVRENADALRVLPIQSGCVATSQVATAKPTVVTTTVEDDDDICCRCRFIMVNFVFSVDYIYIYIQLYLYSLYALQRNFLSHFTWWGLFFVRLCEIWESEFIPLEFGLVRWEFLRCFPSAGTCDSF